jgi:hypothetical protein
MSITAHDHYDLVRAVLKEVREPTEALVMSAKNVIDIETLKAAQISLTPELMASSIRAMIDEALK